MAEVQRAADMVAESGGRAAEQVIKPVRDVDLPEFQQWFGDSKVVDEKGEPVVDPNLPGPHTDMGAVFLTADPAVASHYAQVGALFGDRSPNVVPAYVRARNPFDYENAAHRAAVVDRVFDTAETFTQGDGEKALVLDGHKTLYTKSVLDARLAKGSNWDLIERKVVQDAIKHQGHDGFYVKEETKNLGGLRPEAGQVRHRQLRQVRPEARRSRSAARRPAGRHGRPEAARHAAWQRRAHHRGRGPEAHREEQKQDGQWADLVKVAAECALSAG
jgi:hypothetical protein